MDVRLALRKDKINKHNLCPLVIQLSEGKQLARISTGLSSSISDFDEKKQSFKKSYPNSDEMNNKLRDIKIKIQDCQFHYNEIINHRKFNPIQGSKPEIFKLLFDGLNSDIEALKEAIVTEYSDRPKSTKHPSVYLPRNIDVKKLAKVKELVSKVINEDASEEVNQILNLPNVVKSKLSSEDNDTKKKEKEFLDAWQKYEDYSKFKNKESTYSRMPNNLQKIKKFAKSKNIPLTFENMTEEFGMQFIFYLENSDHNYVKDRKGQSEGTVHNIIKSISTFLNWAVSKKYHYNLDFKNWKTKKPKTDLFYLKENQLIDLYHFGLKPGSSYDITRDLFLFSSYTGMRYSDIENWNSSNEFDGVIKFRSVKAKKDCIVGISPIVRSILDKYKNNLPIQANSKLNLNIKEILKAMELNEKVQKRIRYGKKEEITESKLADVITFHSGRRSFINLMLSKGVSIVHLSTMTGNTVNSLMVYYKNDATEIKRIVGAIEFLA